MWKRTFPSYNNVDDITELPNSSIAISFIWLWCKCPHCYWINKVLWQKLTCQIWVTFGDRVLTFSCTRWTSTCRLWLSWLTEWVSCVTLPLVARSHFSISGRCRTTFQSAPVCRGGGLVGLERGESHPLLRQIQASFLPGFNFYYSCHTCHLPWQSR